MRENRMEIISEIKKAILREDEFFKGVIKLPKPQKTGTYTQRNTYLNLATQKVFNEYKKLLMKGDLE